METMEEEWVRRREERRAMEDERERKRARELREYFDWQSDQHRFDPDFWTSVWRAVAENRVEDMRQMLFEFPELLDERSGPDGTTPLMEAMAQGHSYTARLLLDFGADPSA